MFLSEYHIFLPLEEYSGYVQITKLSRLNQELHALERLPDALVILHFQTNHHSHPLLHTLKLHHYPHNGQDLSNSLLCHKNHQLRRFHPCQRKSREDRKSFHQLIYKIYLHLKRLFITL